MGSMDSNNSKNLYLSDMTAVKIPEELEDYITVNGVNDLFEVLDINGDGIVSEAQFKLGVLNFAQCQKASTETTPLLKLLRMMRRYNDGSESTLRMIQQRMTVS